MLKHCNAHNCDLKLVCFYHRELKYLLLMKRILSCTIQGNINHRADENLRMDLNKYWSYSTCVFNYFISIIEKNTYHEKHNSNMKPLGNLRIGIHLPVSLEGVQWHWCRIAPGDVPGWDYRRTAFFYSCRHCWSVDSVPCPPHDPPLAWPRHLCRSDWSHLPNKDIKYITVQIHAYHVLPPSTKAVSLIKREPMVLNTSLKHSTCSKTGIFDKTSITKHFSKTVLNLES